MNPSRFAASFSPADISDGKAWYNFADLSTITKDGSDKVSAVTNAFGTDLFDLAQATGGNQPLWESANQNGNDVITFASADFMETGNITAVAQPMTFYLAVEVPATQLAGISEFLRSTAGTTNQHGLHATGSPNIMNAQMDASTMTSGAVAGILGSWHLIRLIINGASSSWEIDGVARGTGNLGTASQDNFKISSATTTSTWVASMGEYIIYNKVVSGDEDTSMKEYLQAKWSTPALP